jgi:prepilin-type N-terminal cleavage/methylation domain-containing protein/prepilin-type processing-associated H-X9-DG protein
MKMSPQVPRRAHAAFTMMEMIIVVTIIAVLTTMAFPVYSKLQRMANETVTVNGLKQIVAATMTWAADHGDKVPSPLYNGTEKNLPHFWKTVSDGQEGLWLNGVVFAQIYIEEPDSAMTVDDSTQYVLPGASNIATAGTHLVTTVFESKASVRNMPEERDWFRHSYAMNANLMYDELATLDGSADPWLTEKALSKFEPSAAMIFIDFIDDNIVMASDFGSLEEVADKRYEGRMVMAAYLDGHVSKLHPRELPSGDPESDRAASLFWRGVLPQR